MRISDKILCRCRMGTSNPWEKNASKLPLKRNWPLYSIWNTVSRSELKIYGLPIFGSFHQIKSTSAGLFSEVHSSGDWDFSVLDYSSLFRNNQGTRSCSFLFYSAGNFKQVYIQENHYLILLVLLNQFGSTEMSSSYSIKIWIWLYCVLSTYPQQYRIGLRREKKNLSPLLHPNTFDDSRKHIFPLPHCFWTCWFSVWVHQPFNILLEIWHSELNVTQQVSAGQWRFYWINPSALEAIPSTANEAQGCTSY